MNVILCLLATGLLISSAQAANPTRDWTSSDGKSKFQGDLIEFSDKEVKIRRRSDFNQFRLPLDRLSKEDQEYFFDTRKLG